MGPLMILNFLYVLALFLSWMAVSADQVIETMPPISNLNRILTAILAAKIMLIFTWLLVRAFPPAETVTNAELKRQKELLGQEIATKDAELERLKAKVAKLQRDFDRAAVDYEWAIGMWQDQVYRHQERETRIVYLEQRLAEFGRMTPSGRAPLHSAPATQTEFANVPRRRGGSVAFAVPGAYVANTEQN